MEFALYGAWPITQEWPNPIWEKIRSDLDEKKRQAEKCGEPHAFTLPTGEHAIMKPFGASLGYAYARWIVVTGGLTFLLVDAPLSRERPGVTVRATSWACMMLGGPGVYGMACRILAGLGWAVTRSATPQRVDVCVDLTEDLVTPVATSHLAGAIVRRCKQGGVRFFGDQYSGYEVGKKTDCQLQIYDKLLELKQSEGVPENELKRLYLEANRWGGRPEKASRVEFRMASDFLRRNFNVTSCEDLFEKIGSITQWLTADWFRVTDGVDRGNGHQSRALANDLWRRVQAGFHAWSGLQVKPLERPIREAMTSRKLWQQADGLLTTLAAREGVADDPAEFSAWVNRKFYGRASELASKMTAKRAAVDANLPALERQRKTG